MLALLLLSHSNITLGFLFHISISTRYYFIADMFGLFTVSCILNVITVICKPLVDIKYS